MGLSHSGLWGFVHIQGCYGILYSKISSMCVFLHFTVAEKRVSRMNYPRIIVTYFSFMRSISKVLPEAHSAPKNCPQGTRSESQGSLLPPY